MSHDTFDIPITWKDAELCFPARFVAAGFITKMIVDVYGREFMLEPDEEGQYRVLLDAEELDQHSGKDLPLLKEIVRVLNEVNSAG